MDPFIWMNQEWLSAFYLAHILPYCKFNFDETSRSRNDEIIDSC